MFDQERARYIESLSGLFKVRSTLRNSQAVVQLIAMASLILNVLMNRLRPEFNPTQSAAPPHLSHT